MDDHRTLPERRDVPDTAETQADRDRLRIAQRDAKLAWRRAQPAEAAVEDARWRAENAAAIESWNAWVREHGLPLARYRVF